MLGLKKEEVDGLLINANMSPEMSPLLQMTLGFEDLSLLNVMNAYGSTAGTMIQYACMAIEEGLANVVALVYADDPLKPSNSASSSYSGASVMPLRGMEGLRLAYGSYGANPSYALAARRHMHLFGTTNEQLGSDCHLAAPMGADESVGTDAQAADDGGLPELALYR